MFCDNKNKTTNNDSNSLVLIIFFSISCTSHLGTITFIEYYIVMSYYRNNNKITYYCCCFAGTFIVLVVIVLVNCLALLVFGSQLRPRHDNGTEASYSKTSVRQQTRLKRSIWQFHYAMSIVNKHATAGNIIFLSTLHQAR